LRANVYRLARMATLSYFNEHGPCDVSGSFVRNVSALTAPTDSIAMTVTARIRLVITQ